MIKWLKRFRFIEIPSASHRRKQEIKDAEDLTLELFAEKMAGILLVPATIGFAMAVCAQWAGPFIVPLAISGGMLISAIGVMMFIHAKRSISAHRYARLSPAEIEAKIQQQIEKIDLVIPDYLPDRI